MFQVIRSKLNRMSIGYQLVVHFLLISILPSIGLGLVVGYTVDGLIKSQVKDSTNQVINKVNETIEFYVGNVQKLSYLVALNPNVKAFIENASPTNPGTADVDEIRAYLRNLTMLYPEVAGIMIANQNGAYLSNDMYPRSLDSLIEETWYQEAARKRGVFTLLGHPRNQNVAMNATYKSKELINVTRAFVNPTTKQVDGVVLITMKARVIAETAKSVRLGKTGYLFIVDDSGDNIYSPTYPFTSQIQKPWLTGKTAGTFQDEVGGSKLQFIYRKSAFTNWTTVGVYSSGDYIFGIQSIKFYILSFLFVIAALGVTATTFLSTSLSTRLKKMMRSMITAERGDLSVEHEETKQDEIGMLGRSFNKMIGRIRSLLDLYERQERKKREAELRALQEHIKPHFLYNTLDTIQWMARKENATDIAEMVDSLSRLFRIGLSNGREIISVEDEIAHIRSYLTIQQIRYRDKLSYSITCLEDVQRLRVLKLIIQPIVENAIYHGIKERRGMGHVHIDVRDEGDSLSIRIEDDGKGMDEATLAQVRTKLAQSFAAQDGLESEAPQGGYGMLNVQARLKLTFGEEYGISIESTLGQGTIVSIRHPRLEQ